MTKDELDKILISYAYEILTYEEIHNFGSPEKFHKWIRKHIIPINKSELEVGKEYSGECRNANKAIWNGEKFIYTRYKFGIKYQEKINHYEDDDGYDVFVPIKEVNNEI